MDALSDVLRVAHLTGGVFLHATSSAVVHRGACSGASIAGLRSACVRLIIYHYVIEGELRIRVDVGDDKALVIRDGEIVILPRNDCH